MCGICGRLELDPDRPASLETVQAMVGRLRHRGPDDSGTWTRGPIALGHTRLSIIDLEGGQQPITNETGSVSVVYNGEIYNFRELRSRLAALGHRFETSSDTEVVVHAYEEWGTESVRRLAGMFAYALWDDERRRLLLVRDRLGIKPLLYHHRKGESISFASEMKALWADPDLARSADVDPVAIDQYLSLQYVPAPRTGLEGVRKLPAAHYLVVDSGEVRMDRYWDPADVSPITSRPEARRRIREALSGSVESHLVSDVPLGTFLSGGLDSGVVTALMARASTDPVQAITVGFAGSEVDERPQARTVAARYGCDHHERVLEEDALETFDRVAECLDEPFADWSTLPTFLVSEEARRHVKVVLSGDGGDELFGGYTRHRIQRMERVVRAVTDRLPAALRNRIVDTLLGLPGVPGATRHLAREPVAGIAGKHAHGFFEGPHQRRGVMAPALRDQLEGGSPDSQPFMEPFLRHADRVRDRDLLDTALYLELSTYLADDILVKTDRMSMAHSLEVRVPFLDHRVVETAVAIPAQWKVGWRRGKQIYRTTFRDLLPDDIWNRPKQGFDIPAARWLRGPLRDRARELLLGSTSRGRGLLDPVGVERIWDEHQSLEREHSRRLWALMMLEVWARRWEEARTDALASEGAGATRVTSTSREV